MPSEATVSTFRPYSAAEVQAISDQLTTVYGHAEKDLLNILTRGNISSWKRAYTTQQIAQVKAICAGLTDAAGRWADTHVTDLYRHGMWVADGYLQPGGLSVAAHPGEWTPMDLGMARMHDVAVQVLTENSALTLGEANSYCAQRIESMVARTQALGQLAEVSTPQGMVSSVQLGIRDASLDAMQEAFAQGKTMKQASDAFEAELRKRGITEFVDRTGRQWDMETYCDMVTNTVAQEAQRHGLQNRLQEAGEDLVEIIGGGNDTCDRCKPYAGEVLSITGATPGYPTIDEARSAGLFHPHCTHTAVPYIVG